MKNKFLSVLLSMSLIASALMAFGITASANEPIDISGKLIGYDYTMEKYGDYYVTSGTYRNSPLFEIPSTEKNSGTINFTCNDANFRPNASWSTCLMIANSGTGLLTFNLIVNGDCSFSGTNNWAGIVVRGNVKLNLLTTDGGSLTASCYNPGSSADRKSFNITDKSGTLMDSSNYVNGTVALGENTKMTRCEVNNNTYASLDEAVKVGLADIPFKVFLIPEVHLDKLTTTADAGYYSSKSNGADKEGIIAFNSFYENYETAEPDKFGMYFYNTAALGEEKAKLEAYDIDALKANEGKFYATVEKILSEDFTKPIIAVPYVVIDEIIYIGDPCSATVKQFNKWLGEKATE